MPIILLAQDVAAKIAAGEVVERPSSVVKELLDNAIDAGATTVSVELRGGGMAMIRVTDNGGGIPRDELPLAFERHATSKISSLADLDHIVTLGFRGEALASIAAVAEVTLTSRPAGEDVAYSVTVDNGRLASQGVRGAPPGTIVTVKDLFASVPARLKFLRSTLSEGSQCQQIVQHLAMAHPHVRFTLLSEDRLLLTTPGTGRLLDTLRTLFGPRTAEQLIELDPADALSASQSGAVEATVSGYVAPQSLHRANRAHVHFFVNGRPVQSRILMVALEDAYRTLLPIGRHPLAVVNVHLDPALIDVNVHPAKTEVRFLQERQTFAAVQRVARAAVLRHAPIPDAGDGSDAPLAELVESPARSASVTPAPMWSGQSGDLGAARPRFEVGNGGEASPAPIARGPDADLLRSVDSARPLSVEPPPGKLPVLRVLGQVAQTYIIAEGPDGLYLIDQHTAHERVMYERLMYDRDGQATRSQLLLQPVSVPVAAEQMGAFAERQEFLNAIGFQIEASDEQNLSVKAVPASLQRANPAATLLELLDTGQDGVSGPGWRELALQRLACRSAVKAGQLLTVQEQRELISQLEGTVSPRTCIHGRPTLVRLGLTQLEREFLRR